MASASIPQMATIASAMMMIAWPERRRRMLLSTQYSARIDDPADMTNPVPVRSEIIAVIGANRKVTRTVPYELPVVTIGDIQPPHIFLPLPHPLQLHTCSV